MQGDMAKYKKRNMAKNLQKKLIIDVCKRYGISPDAIDIEHLLDASLTYRENLQQFVKDYLFALMTEENKIKFLSEHTDLKGAEEEAEKIAIQEWRNYAIKEAENSKEDVCKEFKNLDIILKEIENYNLYQKNLTYSTILALSGKHKYCKFNVLNIGGAGVGKSWSSYNLVSNLLNVPHCILHNSILTPKRFFMFVKENSDKIIIEDEADLLLSDKKTKVMLKYLLFYNKLCWETVNEYEEVNFNGSIIMNANIMGEMSILDRCFTNIVKVSNTLILKKIEQIQNYTPNTHIWDIIRKRIVYCYNSEEEQQNALLSKEEENKIYELLNVLVCNKKEQVSFRIINKAKELFYRLKLFFGVSPLKNKLLLDLYLDLLTNYV